MGDSCINMLQKIKSTEKIVRMIEAENCLVFETDKNVTKDEIKKEIEKLFAVQVKTVNTHIRKGKKIAYVKLKPEFQAVDLASKLGLM